MRVFRWSCLVLLFSTGCIVVIEDVKDDKGQGGSSTGGTAGAGGSTTGGSGGNPNGGSPNGGAGNGANGGTGAANGGSSGNGGSGGNGGGVTGGGTGGIGTCGVGMVSVKANAADYCIDQYEVTQGEYQKFLGVVKPNQADPCTLNTFQVPSCDWNPDGDANRPVVCVDWCDAKGYCELQNKRLCGKIGGGSLDPGAVTDASQDEWYAACSNEGSLIYPYGILYDASFCNGIDAPTIAPVDVGSFAKCIGGYPGLYDMSGNVKEWEAACTTTDCYVRGGSYTDLPAGLACKNGAVLTARTAVDKGIGFRCCK